MFSSVSKASVKANTMKSQTGLHWQVARAVVAEDLGLGFAVPPLIRFVNGEQAYLANSNGGPRMFFNIEDHLSKSTGVENTKFQARPLSKYAAIHVSMHVFCMSHITSASRQPCVPPPGICTA